jgi:hypothetical protein
LCLNPLGIATVGFAHLAMTQYTISHINYNFRIIKESNYA